MPALPAPLPTEKLRDAVDLIVVSAVGEGEQLIEKLAQPGRVPGKDDSSRLEIRQLSLGARQLVALRLNADGNRHTRVAVVAQLLVKILFQSGSGLLPRQITENQLRDRWGRVRLS